jgi:F0F1-type ATP synthase membrane subunit b/b'
MIDGNDLNEAMTNAAEMIRGAIRDAARELGNGGAATSMGALEAHGAAIREAARDIADAIRDLAEAIREH